MKTLCTYFFSLLVPALLSSQNWYWATKTTSPIESYQKRIALDNAGNSYVTGEFKNSLTLGGTTLNKPGWCGYLAKYDVGGVLQWAVITANGADVYSDGICLDQQGNIAVTGHFFQSTSFSASIPVTLTATGGYDIYTAKYNASGQLLWARALGGTPDDASHGISSDKAGNLYIAGEFFVNGLFTSSDTVFVAKYSPSGTLGWISRSMNTIGVNLSNCFGGIKTDSLGNSYVAGEFFNNIAFNTTVSATIAHPEMELYIAKFDSNGTNLWIQHAGAGSGYTHCTGIDIDKSGNSYIVGWYHGTIAFQGTSLPAPPNGTNDSYVAKCDNNGNFIWVKNIPGYGTNDLGAHICINAQNECYYASYFTDSISVNGQVLKAKGLKDVYLARLDNAGNVTKTWLCGGSGDDMTGGIASSSYGTFITGSFDNAIDFMPSSLSLSITAGSSGGFLARIADVNTTAIPVIPITGISVFPNPVTAQLNIRVPDYENTILNIYNSLGERIVSQRLDNTSSSISFESYAEGIYIAELLQENRYCSMKIIKQ